MHGMLSAAVMLAAFAVVALAAATSVVWVYRAAGASPQRSRPASAGVPADAAGPNTAAGPDTAAAPDGAAPGQPDWLAEPGWPDGLAEPDQAAAPRVAVDVYDVEDWAGPDERGDLDGVASRGPGGWPNPSSSLYSRGWPAMDSSGAGRAAADAAERQEPDGQAPGAQDAGDPAKARPACTVMTRMTALRRQLRGAGRPGAGSCRSRAAGTLDRRELDAGGPGEPEPGRRERPRRERMRRKRTRLGIPGVRGCTSWANPAAAGADAPAARRAGRRPSTLAGMDDHYATTAPASPGAELHPDLAPLAFLLGRWEGAGVGGYPTIESFQFGQEISFSHNGKPFLSYTSRTWRLDAEGRIGQPLATEAGFWRPQPEGKVELMLAHPTGITEIYLGEVSGHRVDLATDVVARTSSAKEVTAGRRLYGLIGDDLGWAFDMAAVGQPLQSHISAQLKRVG